jgi:dTDP-4-dehydrorhamnose 3,5-epimerase
MNIIPTDLPEVLIIEPKVFGDQRGFFLETYQFARYAAAGIGRPFVQDNMSRSSYGVLRGLHLQNPMTQGKLVSVLRGRVVDVAVDVRLGSPNFGRHVAVELSEENRRQLWVPRGFAHGFVVLSETADFFYKCDEIYSPKDETTVRPPSESGGSWIARRYRPKTPRRRCCQRLRTFPSTDTSDADPPDGDHGAGRQGVGGSAGQAWGCYPGRPLGP